jgi:hypothetical protein
MDNSVMLGQLPPIKISLPEVSQLGEGWSPVNESGP